MSVLLSPVSLIHEDDDYEDIAISNGEWCAILALGEAFGIDVTPPATHDAKHYSPEVLQQLAYRIEQISRAPQWLRWLADHGGANLS